MSKGKNNYIKLFFILTTVVLITIIICNLYRNYENNKGNVSYLSKYISTINCKELTSALTELNSNTYVYLSYAGNKNIYEFEKRLRKNLKQYDLEDNFIYVNCTSEIDDNNQVTNLQNILSLKNHNLTLPAIVYFKDSFPQDYIDSKDGLINIGDFSKMLDRNEIEVRK